MVFSDLATIRAVSQLDEASMVPDALVTTRQSQAYRMIYKLLKPAYKVKVDGATLTVAEAYDLNIGEATLATSLICKSLSLKFTLYKFNRSIASGIGGGQSDRDSRKNIDFKNMFETWWEEAWGVLADYVTSIPNIGPEGNVDPYTHFNFDAVKNTDLESTTLEEQAMEVNYG